MAKQNKANPRYQNGALRRKYRQYFKTLQLPCHICGQPIRYEDPSDSKHPLSFVIDEVIPISKAEAHGYSSRRAAAEDINNLAPAHWICNARKGNRTGYAAIVKNQNKINRLDGNW